MIGSTKVRQFQLTKNSIVAETFRIYKSNGIELASIQLFLSGPLLLISLYCESSLSDYIFSDQVTGETFQYIDNLVAILLIAMGLRLIVSPIGYAIQYFAISKILQDKKFHWKDAWPIVRIKAGSLIVAYFLFILTIVFAGLIFSTVWILISLSWDGGLMLILISTGLFTIFLLFLLILFIMLPLHILTHSQPLGMHISQTSRLAYRNFRVIPVLMMMPASIAFAVTLLTGIPILFLPTAGIAIGLTLVNAAVQPLIQIPLALTYFDLTGQLYEE